MGNSSLPAELQITSEEAERILQLGFKLEFESEISGAGDSQNRLILRDLNHPKVQPLSVDFLSDQLTYRREKSLGKNQTIAKAIGVKSTERGESLTVIDATAGLGTDAFLFGVLGCSVLGIERSPVVYALLKDGHRRLVEWVNENRDVDPVLQSVANRVTFLSGQAAKIIQEQPHDLRPDVIYLDPMYPEEGRSKSALPKKGMQIFRRLIGEDFDADEVFSVAMDVARSRVVVKRPVRAPHLGEVKPTHIFEGKTSRFDMYLRGK